MRNILASLFFVLTTLYATGQEPPEISNNLPTIQTEHQFDSMKRSISVVGVGDMMMGTIFPEKGMHLPEDPFSILDEVKIHLQSADLTFGNLEGSFTDVQIDSEMKQCKDPSKCYAFRMPEAYGQILTDAGFDMVSLANNHVGDFGNTGRKRCMATLERIGVEYAGLLQKQYALFEKDGIRYGLLAVSPNNGTVRINDYKNTVKIVKALKRTADIVIVSFHGGAEGPKHRHVTRKTEIFYGEDRGNVYEFAHLMIDNGADIVFGHGPHITRAVELYKDRFITYSMGNFCTYHRFNLSGHNGVAPIIKLNVKPNGEFIDGEIIPIKQLGEGIPHVDSSKRALKEIIDLTNTDFPNGNLKFDLSSGKISKK